MIASADGAVALAGRSGGLSGPADRLVFAVLRSLADVVLVGAGTARAESYKPVDPRQLIGRLRPGRSSAAADRGDHRPAWTSARTTAGCWPPTRAGPRLSC